MGRMGTRDKLATGLGRGRTLALLAAFAGLRPRERPMLTTPEHLVPKPRVPAIDAHCHLHDEFAGAWRDRPASAFLTAFDRFGVDRVVDVSGGTGERLKAELRRVAPLGDRVAVFAGLELA